MKANQNIWVLCLSCSNDAAQYQFDREFELLSCNEVEGSSDRSKFNLRVRPTNQNRQTILLLCYTEYLPLISKGKCHVISN